MQLQQADLAVTTVISGNIQGIRSYVATPHHTPF